MPATAYLPPDADAPPRLAIVCLSLAAGGSAMAMRINDALLPELAQVFGVPLTTTAQVVSLYALAYGAAQLLWGPIGDRFGKYRVVAWAVLACALASVACGLAGSFGHLRGARVLAGMLAAAIIPLAIAWIADVVPYERRQPVLARFLIGQITGLAAGVWLGGVAADHLGWRTPYFVLAAVYGLVGLLMMVGLRRLPTHSSGRVGRAAAPSPAGTGGAFRAALGERWAQILLLIVFLEGTFLFGPLAFMAAHLHQRLGVSLTVAGSLVMVFGAGGLAYALAARRLVSGLGEAGLARSGAVCLCLGLSTIALAPSWLFGVLGSLLSGLGFYMLHNTLQVNATQMAPQARGAAVSLFAACFFLGQSVGVTMTGWLSIRVGSGLAIGLGGGALLCIGLGFGHLLVRRTPTPAQRP